MNSSDSKLFSIHFPKTVADDDEWRSTQQESSNLIKNSKSFGQLKCYVVLENLRECDEFGSDFGEL